MKVIRIMSPKEDGESFYIEFNSFRCKEILGWLDSFLDDCEIGDSIGFSVEEMPREEFESLPEFQGW